MRAYNFIIIVSLISMSFFQSGCSKKDKWKAVPLQIKKQESFNYSEMISGKLDSSARTELEAVKKKTAREIEDNLKRISENPAKGKSKETSLINKVWHRIKNIYSWFIDLF